MLSRMSALRTTADIPKHKADPQSLVSWRGYSRVHRRGCSALQGSSPAARGGGIPFEALDPPKALDAELANDRGIAHGHALPLRLVAVVIIWPVVFSLMIAFGTILI